MHIFNFLKHLCCSLNKFGIDYLHQFLLSILHLSAFPRWERGNEEYAVGANLCVRPNLGQTRRSAPTEMERGNDTPLMLKIIRGFFGDIHIVGVAFSDSSLGDLHHFCLGL